MKTTVVKAALGVLIFSYLVEFLQFINFIELIGLRKSEVARTAIGQSFDWLDILTYTLGVWFVIAFERLLSPRISTKI